MAQFGAKRPRFAPVATTPAGALPTYTYENAVTIGKLVQANLTVTNASGELYADDGLAEKLDMFASGSLELQTDDKTAEVHAALHGATLDEESDEVTDSANDVAPRGGLALSAPACACIRAFFTRLSAPYSATIRRPRRATASPSAPLRPRSTCSSARRAPGASARSSRRRPRLLHGVTRSSATLPAPADKTILAGGGLLPPPALRAEA